MHSMAPDLVCGQASLMGVPRGCLRPLAFSAIFAKCGDAFNIVRTKFIDLRVPLSDDKFGIHLDYPLL